MRLEGCGGKEIRGCLVVLGVGVFGVKVGEYGEL